MKVHYKMLHTGMKNRVGTDESKTHIFFKLIFLSFLRVKVPFNAELWNLHLDLCFARF